MSADDDMALEHLLSEEDLELLKSMAAQAGVTPEELAKKGIQDLITRRTRPRTMPGTVQPFRRRAE